MKQGRNRGGSSGSLLPAGIWVSVAGLREYAQGLTVEEQVAVYLRSRDAFQAGAFTGRALPPQRTP
jgi:hypothetical protein